MGRTDLPSLARKAFLEGVTSLEETLEEPWAVESTSRGAFVRRGLTVASFNLLETFILERLDEIAFHLNTGNLLYAELPDQLQLKAARNAIEVANSRLKRSDQNEISQLVIDLSKTLTSLHQSPVSFSALSWAWSGSNMSVDGYASALRRFHVQKPYDRVREVAGRIGFQITDTTDGSALDLSQQLAELAKNRHGSAHNSTYAVSTMWLKTVGKKLLQFGSSFDILASIGALNLKAATADYYANSGWTTADRATFHFILERRQDFALLSEINSRRARRVSNNGDDLFRIASRSPKLNDVIVRLDQNNRLVDWTIPTIS